MSRVDRVRNRLAESGAEALLISDLTNIRWLTGFTGSNGWVILGPDQVTLITDGRYGEQAALQMAAAGVVAEVLVGATGAATQAHLAETTQRYRATGFEAAHVSYQQHASWSAAFGTTLTPTAGIVEAERRTKDDAEIEAMAVACRIADQALAEVASSLGSGLTEAQVRNKLEIRMRELGAIGPSYETIVATGPTNAALPHHRPTDKLIEPGHTVIIDVGALVDGYHSDMTRSFVIGTPTADQHEMYDLVLRAQMAGVDAVRPGLDTRDLDAICRGIITDAGFGDWFTHGTGHGVGLLIHEDPFVNASTSWVLQEGDVVTVEPGVYRGGFGGIRVEDLVEVTSSGGRTLTRSPKDSPCLPSAPTT